MPAFFNDIEIIAVICFTAPTGDKHSIVCIKAIHIDTSQRVFIIWRPIVIFCHFYTTKIYQCKVIKTFLHFFGTYTDSRKSSSFKIKKELGDRLSISLRTTQYILQYVGYGCAVKNLWNNIFLYYYCLLTQSCK